jgi:chromosome segregation protein
MEQLTQTQEQSAEELAQSEEAKQGLQENLAIAQEKLELATQERDRLRESLRSSEMSAQEAAFATRSLQQRIADLQRIKVLRAFRSWRFRTSRLLQSKSLRL